MPTRRQTLALLLASTFAMRLPFQATKADAAGVLPPDLVLNRLSFGATAESRDRLAELGLQGWLEEQLALPPEPPELKDRLAAAQLRMLYEAGEGEMGGSWPARDEMLGLTLLDADPASLVPLLDWESAMDWAERTRPANEVVAASLIRAVHSPAQLREVMTQFWHDHFNVHSEKDEYTACFFAQYDAGLRAHALGSFRALLGHIATSPSMLVYLTNDESRASPANENFARELLELHTLGAGAYLNDRIADWRDVPGAAEGLAMGYLDDDVWEVARAFTGWTIGDGRYVDEGETTPKTGLFAYVEAWHDPYQKRILGREFPSHAAPMADGEAVLDMLSAHPGTARFICTKIARRLLSDEPDPALVERLAGVFLAQSGADDQIAQVLRALVSDPAFQAPATKLRRPFEMLAALLRATGATVQDPENGFAWYLSRAGWQQHRFPPPTGHPDRAEDWINGNTVLRLADLALYAHEEWVGITSTRLSDNLPEGLETMADLAAHWGRALGVDLDPALLAAMEVDPASPLPEDAVERHDYSNVLVAAAALTPAFLFR